jgi:hypothetical protein
MEFWVLRALPKVDTFGRAGADSVPFARSRIVLYNVDLGDQSSMGKEKAVSTSDVRTETREVSDFDRVALAGFGHLIITQGDRESLEIEAPQDMLDRIETEVEGGQLTIGFKRTWMDWIDDVLAVGLSGKPVRYNLTVKRLSNLLIMGAARVQVTGLKTEQLAVDLRGTGEVRIASLDAERLEVSLPGAGAVRASGRSTEQTVTINGAAIYEAGELRSQRVKATVHGVGNATVWAVEELDATIRGVGEVSYYGSPTVRQLVDVPTVGGVKSLGDHP